MKLLTITFNDLGISWGPAIHFLELWNAFCFKKNVNITGLAPSWSGARPIIEPAFSLKLIRVCNLPILRQFLFDIYVSTYLFSHAREYEMVYIRLSSAQFFTVFTMRCLKFRFVVEVNGLALEDNQSNKSSIFRSSLSKLNESLLLHSSSLIICVSEGIAQTVKERYSPSATVSVITNGVGKQFFRKSTNVSGGVQRLSVIYVGTFTPWDGAEKIITLAKKFPNVDFVLVGDGSRRIHLESIATENVFFKGWVNYLDLPDIYAKANAAIVLYEEKRHSNVTLSSLKTLEYVASRLPIFSTDVPGQEFIQKWGVGMLASIEGIDDTFAEFLCKQNDFHAQYASLNDAKFYEISWHRCADMTAHLMLSGESLDANDVKISN